MLVKDCNCKCIKEQPSVPGMFILEDGADIPKAYEALFQEYKTLLIMYNNAGTAFDSVEDRLRIEQDCRVQFETAYVDLRDRYRKMGLIHS